MSILNVNQIQPVGGGSTITVSANDVNFSGNISIGSSFVGTASTASLATSAQGLTGTPDITVGNIQSGVVTATTFIGDGSGLTGVTASGSGINIKDNGSTVGVAATIDFSTNLNVSPASAGIVTVTVGDTDFAIADKIIHTGDTNTAIRFPAADTITAETAGSERLRINSSGNIGIGTDNPGAILEVFDATSNTILNVKSGDSGAALNLIDDSARSSIEQNGTTLRISSDTGAEDADSDIRLQVDGSTKMLVNSSGNIGIATANPNDHNSFSRALDINGPSGAAVYMRTAGSSTNTLIIGNYGSEAYLNNVANGNLRFYTQGDERVRITNTGNVGIATNNPTFGQSTPVSTYNPKLGVEGSIIIGNLSTTASDRSELQFYRRASSTTAQPIDTHDMGRIAWYGSSNDSDNANLAWSIGVNPDGGTWTSGSNRKGYMTFNNHDGEKLRIDSSGRVGINTNTFNDAAEALRVQAPSGQNNTQLTIKAGSTSGYSVLNFGDDDFNEGRIKYDHSTNTMEFFADDTGFMKYIDDSTGGRFSVTSTGTYLTATTVDYYCNFNSSRTYGQYINKNGTGTYGLYSYTLGGNSTQYSIYGQIDTSSAYSSGGGLFYSINSNTYGIVGYWSGGNSGSYYTIYGNGVSLCTGGHTTSDARLKDVQSGIGTGILDKVCSLEAKKYTWKENTQQRRSVGVGTQIGLLAQDVLEHFPEVVMEHENPEITGANPETLNEQIGTTYSIDYGKMTAVLIEAIKDLKAENNALAARVAALEGS